MRTSGAFRTLMLVATLVVLSGGSAQARPSIGDGNSAPAPAAAATGQGSPLPAMTAVKKPAKIKLPPVNGRFDYQIGGPYTPSASVAVVSRDRSEKPASGKYNICYINAFQTQPGEAAFWTGSHSNLLLKNSNGSYVIDPDWPDEYILDTSSAAKRKAIAGIVNRWIDGCAKAGYQAVEPDNLDTWTRSKKLLTKANNVALATVLVKHAHSRKLAIAQKNTADLGRTGKTKIKFDFAIAEECQVYDECDAYTEPYGNHVIEIEYTDNDRSAYTEACAAQGQKISVILRDRDVVAKGKAGYTYQAC